MAISKDEWNLTIKKIIVSAQSFNHESSSKKFCRKFVVGNQLIGYIRPNVLEILEKFYNDVFAVVDDEVRLNIKYQTPEERTKVVENVLLDMKDKNLFVALNSWRNEQYDVKSKFFAESPMKIDRGAIAIFAIRCFGCHINGYIKENDEYKLWISRRSLTKSTYPGMLDNFASGGITSGLSVVGCAKKEIEEETGLDYEFLSHLKPVDALCFSHEEEEGIYLENIFMFDIKLPNKFQPKNKDGEVESFYLMCIDEVKQAIINEEFKPTSALVTLSFMFRKGLIDPDDDENYIQLLESMHTSGL